MVSDGRTVHLGQRTQFVPETGKLPDSGGERKVLFAPWGFLVDNTAAGASSHGMSFHHRPWTYTEVRRRGEPRGISWQHPLKGNVLAFDESGVFGVVEQWAKSPRRKVWETFGSPAGSDERWNVAAVEAAQRPRALVAARNALLIAFAHPSGSGGILWVLSRADGRKLAEIPLPDEPRWDGMAVVPGRLFITTAHGRALCLEGRMERD
jgi:hypothetical protein